MPRWEDQLPPLMKARLAAVGESGPEERDLARQKAEVQSLLADFHKEYVDPPELCRRLRAGGRFTITEAQLSLAQSLSLSYSSHGFERRKTAILELERLKKDGKVNLVEQSLNKIGDMQRAYREAQEKTLRQVVEERNLSRDPAITRGGWISLHRTLPTDADMTERLAESLLLGEREYGEEFAATVRQLASLIDPGRQR